MKTLSILALLSIFIFSGVLYANADEATPNIVINEIDTNPPGDDAKAISEWVELYNPTDKSVDVGGWQIASTVATKRTLTIPAGVVIPAGKFSVFSYASMWFADVSEKVQLKDKSGKVVDETPVITDQKNDFSSWQRKYDGLDTNASNDWLFRMSSVGSSNGASPATSESTGGATVSLSLDKQSYIFDDTVTISGNVSKRISQEKPFFSQQQLVITIDGPGKFSKTITMYPDMYLKFKTSIKTDKVLGITAGTYSVSATYGGVSAYSLFSVGEQSAVAVSKEIPDLSVRADKDAYLPGQRAILSASTTKVIPLVGLKMSVYNAKGTQIYTGSLYPDTKGVFTEVGVFVNTVNPVYGTYNVVADYGTQHTETAFEVVQDVKDTEKIVLITDKQYYGLGDPVVISGRSNKHVTALDLEVLQTSVSIGTDANKNAFKMTSQLPLRGDGTFEYTVSSPTMTLGDYRVTVSKEFGNSVTYFKIVSDPAAYSGTADRDYVSTDKETYDVGDKLMVLGHVVPKTASTFAAIPVYVTLTTEDGKILTFTGVDKSLKGPGADTQSSAYSFSAIPDVAGNYKISIDVTKSLFPPGNYVVTAKYNGKKTSSTFAVISSIDISNKSLILKTDKSVYGLGETVKLDGVLTTGQTSVQIVLAKPDGKTVTSGGKVENNKFSWTWQIPQKEFSQAEIQNARGDRPTVFGAYKISVMTSSQTSNVFFKVSQNPETDTLNTKPLQVTTDKSVYKSGEKLTISGSALNRQDAGSGSVTLDRVQVQVKTSANKIVFSSLLNFDNGGNFKTTYDLPITIFKDGKYKVTATYQRITADATFEVKNNIPINTDDKLTLSLNSDKEEYSPGDTVHISGSLNKVVFLDRMDLVVYSEDDVKINCGTLYCGLGGKQIDLSKYYDSGLYKYDYAIPKTASLGNYVIKVDTEFGTFTKTFKMVEKQVQKTIPPKISEKFNRITDSSIPISLMEKTIENQSVLPKVLQGSLVVARGTESQVNIHISTESGQCVIGQGSDCLVSESTKALDSGYAVVQADGTGFRVQYSGPSTLLETFSITPESDLNTIQDSVWTVDIVKGQNQYSKFYYEIAYVPAQ